MSKHPQSKNPSHVTSASIAYKGPLPPSSEFRNYEQVCSGASDRIMTMAEKEQDHRFEKDESLKNHNDMMIKNDHVEKMAGLIVGGILCLVLVISGLVMVLQGHDWAGGTIVTSTLVGLAGVFVYSNRKS